MISFIIPRLAIPHFPEPILLLDNARPRFRGAWLDGVIRRPAQKLDLALAVQIAQLLAPDSFQFLPVSAH